MGLDKAIRRGMEKENEHQRGMTAEEIEDHVDERTKYRNEYDRAIEEQIITDALTGLANRKGFVGDLKKALESMRRPTEKQRANEQPALEEFALLFIDLDNFKQVNDTLGHDVGDIALQEVAKVLRGSIRKGEVAARLHGDEFAVFLPRTSEKGAEKVAGKILENLKSDSELLKFNIGASIGVRHIDTSNLTEEITPETLIKEADLQQAKAKQTGKSKVVVHQKQ